MMRRFSSVPIGVVFLGVSLAMSPARGECPSGQLFTQPTPYSSGESPFHVAAADFNGDGILDLAVTDNGGSDIGVLLGVGNGTFHDPVRYPVHSGNGHLITVDLDRDGILDIATNSSGTDVITVLRGRGDGTFESEVTYPAGYAPYGVASADFNADGVPDLAAADFLGNGVAVMLGRSSGGFASPVSYGAGVHPYDLETGEFNRDGIVDLVCSNQDSQDISVLLGHGDGTFAASVSYPVQTYPYSIAISDFDHDGVSDLAVANGGSGTVSILKGLGDGTFESARNIAAATQPRSVATGDIDGDGITDLVVADYSGAVSFLRGLGSGGNGNGTFGSPLQFWAGGNATGVAVGDFNADTLSDLAVANFQTNHVSVLLHGCGAPPPPPPNPAPTLTAVRDVPNDQGGRVFVTWLRSGLDGGPTPQVTGYRVWRRIPPAAARGAVIEEAGEAASSSVLVRGLPGPQGTTVTYWEALVTLPAERLEGYGYTAPTTQDSMASGNPYTAFFITALTSDPNVFYQSNVDSGYSVDNIPPAQPGAFSAALESGGVALAWSSNREGDLDGYRIYRGTSSSFTPGAENLVGAAADTDYVDPAGGASSYYKLTAVDRHGNEGPPTLAVPAQPTGVVGVPALELSLRGAIPNPSRNGVLFISFTLPNPTPARLVVLDLAGRRVLEEGVGRLGTGNHILQLGRRSPLPDGIYLVRLEQAGRSAGVKVVVMR